MEIEVKGMVVVQNRYDPYTKVELTKGAKGEYRWSVVVSHATPDDAFEITKRLNADLEKVYGEGAVSHVQ